MGPLRALLYELKENYREQPAFLYVENGEIKSISYDKFLQDISSQSAHYRKLSQDRIGLWGYNSYRWVTAAIGILLAGKHCILFDANLENPELLALAKYGDTELIAVDPELSDEAEELAPYIRTENYGSWEWAEETEEEPEEKDFMCFTSGTSQSTKGVIISSQAFCTSIGPVRQALSGQRGSLSFMPLPFHHIYGFTMMILILSYGGTVCLGRGGRYLMEDMEKFRPQAAFLVPSMLQYMRKKQEWPKSLRTVYTGGSYLQPDLAAAVAEQGIRLRNLYGLSETTGCICASWEEKGTQWLKPVEGVRFIAGPDGEIGVYLPYHMDGYYKKDAETRQVLDKEKHLFFFFFAGELDPDGWVRIKGRIRDTIVMENGEKIHAEDTDRLLIALEGVEDGAVIQTKEGLGAILVPRKGESEEQIRRAVENFNKKRPVDRQMRKIWLRKEPLPRTAAGKLRRFQLELEYGGGNR